MLLHPCLASIVKRFKRGGGEVDPDLLQQAQIGLMKAVDRFDPDRGFRFSTYAVWWVRAEVQGLFAGEHFRRPAPQFLAVAGRSHADRRS